MIAPPVENVDRAVWRAVLEAGAQFFPVTAALTRLYQTTHPSRFEQELVQWRMTISASANDHEARLQRLEETYHPHLALSDEAKALALWLAGHSTTGREDSVDFDEIRAAFPETDKRTLQDAAAELKLSGLATIDAALGVPVLSVSPTFDLFALMDPIVTRTSPQSDAVEIARQALELDAGRIPEIAQRLDWTPRRVNPALALLLPLVSIRSDEISPAYVTRWFAVGADERVKFRRLVAEADRATPRP
ncbi:MAG: hypothetical protein U1C74_26475 [Phenylobacterium sp.]|nr:hypothetical protein [Phenylobacterium sp.]